MDDCFNGGLNAGTSLDVRMVWFQCGKGVTILSQKSSQILFESKVNDEEQLVNQSGCEPREKGINDIRLVFYSFWVGRRLLLKQKH